MTTADLEEPLTFDGEGLMSADGKEPLERCVIAKGDGPSLMPMMTDV